MPSPPSGVDMPRPLVKATGWNYPYSCRSEMWVKIQCYPRLWGVRRKWFNPDTRRDGPLVWCRLVSVSVIHSLWTSNYSRALLAVCVQAAKLNYLVHSYCSRRYTYSGQVAATFILSTIEDCMLIIHALPMYSWVYLALIIRFSASIDTCRSHGCRLPPCMIRKRLKLRSC